MEKWLDFLNFAKGQDAWVYQVFIVVFLTLLANFIARRLLARLHQQLTKTRTIWDETVVDSAQKPLAALIWVIGFSWAAEIVHKVSDAVIFQAIDPIRETLIIALIVWFFIRLIKAVEEQLITPREGKKQADPTTVHAIGKLLRAAVIITGALVILQSLGYSISGVLAFGGIGGVAVGFAAKDLLANFFGGLMIYLDQPFKVGDWIRSPDKEIEGTVEYIGWRLTHIRTFDKRPLYIPNATFANISVENPSRMLNRRIYETIGLRYDDAEKIKPIISEVKAYLIKHPEIDTNQTLIVNFNSFGASSLDFFIYCFTKTINWIRFHEIKEEVLLDIMEIITKHGAEIAFPTRTLHVEPVNIQQSVANS
ncbi:mechanosensitive ion channel family protein [Spartinivicinus ruber]|uniref:mechanosensitive ion channel family protein n=1 Tax=Spartinivicinus ruber TaxID=2683272 RepID=UPI0013D6B3D4|nr:mechanosensitive ion channel family protein [Spartinivicinus ruber]